MKHEMLVKEQNYTLQTERLNYGLLARLLFVSMDLIYGKKRTLSKFKVLEIIARVPYQTWENVAYIAITHTFRKRGGRFARRIFDFVQDTREQQDNEQWHLFILEETIQKKQIKENYLLYVILPQIIAFVYYYISWILYVINPKLSFELNADFEDHAEHEYMEFVKENPQFETEPFQSIYVDDYGQFDSFADVLRQIGVDERHHKEQSLLSSKEPRYC
jgi:hypothetical protein